MPKPSLVGIILAIAVGCTNRSVVDTPPEEAMENWPEFRSLAEATYGLQQVEEGQPITGNEIQSIESEIVAFQQSEIPSAYKSHSSEIEEAKTKFGELLETATGSPGEDLSSELNKTAVILYRLPGGSM